MAHFTRVKKYSQNKPIFVYSEGIRKTRSAQLNGDYITASSDGTKELAAGIFVVDFLDGATKKFRALPKGKVTEAKTTSGTTLKVGYYQVFIPGDTLYIARPYAVITASDTTAGTISVNGITITSTPTGASTAAEAAALHATNFQANIVLNNLFDFVAVDDTVWIIEKDGVSSHTITPGGTFGTTPVTTTRNSNAIGAITAINSSTGEITITNPNSLAVPVGVDIGVINYSSILGITDYDLAFDTYKINADIALATEGYVYQGSLPYWDRSINTFLPNIVVEYTF